MIKVAGLFCFISLLVANTGCKSSQYSQKQIPPPAVAREKWHWNNPQKQNESTGYAQVVKKGNTIYISGIPTADLSPTGIAKLYKALGECLEAFGASPKDVVKETLYTTDIEAMKKCNDARKEFYKGDFPAASWVQVSRLYEPNAKVEVDLIAELANNKN